MNTMNRVDLWAIRKIEFEAIHNNFKCVDIGWADLFLHSLLFFAGVWILFRKSHLDKLGLKYKGV